MNYVIATSRHWYAALASELESQLACPFALIEQGGELTLMRLRSIQPRYIFFPHWSTRIPQDIFENFECIVFHMTDLPFGRGGTPLQNLISRGIYETKISALRCTSTIDAGPVYLKRPLSLYGNAEEIYMRAAEIIRQMIVDIVKGDLVPEEQHGEPTFFKRRKAEESDITKIENLSGLFDHIRMLDAEGYPHAFLETSHFRLEFRRATLKPGCITADVTIKSKPHE